MAREFWRTSELLAQGWRPADLISFLSQRADTRMDGEACYAAARVDAALAKSPRLRAQIVAHVEPPPGEWLHLASAIAEENGVSETTCKRRLGEPATFRLRADKRGFWAGFTVQQVTRAGLRVPEKPKAKTQRTHVTVKDCRIHTAEAL